MALHGVLSHVIFKEFLHLVALVERHLVEAHVGADEVFELVGGDFSQSFKSRDFGVGAELLDGGLAFFLVVAIDGFKL